MIKTAHSLPTECVKLESCTGRLLTDQGPVFFAAKYAGQSQAILRDFCCQGEFTLEEILNSLRSLKVKE
jgi:hypothetical protein